MSTRELASELLVSLMRLVRRLRAQRPDHGLTLTQLSALGTLERLGPMRIGELAEREKVQPPSMTRTVAALEERGLVTRTTDPTDRRNVVVAVSRRGLELLRDDRRRREQWLAARLAELSDDERALLARVAPILDRIARS